VFSISVLDIVASGLDFGNLPSSFLFLFLLNSYAFGCRLVGFFRYEWNRGRSPFRLEKTIDFEFALKPCYVE
jgi:hypothetical protein